MTLTHLLRSSTLRCLSSSTGLSSDVQTAAAIFSLLNDYRISKGMAPFGFVNPFLYDNAWAFNDITSGNNPGCDTEGFSAGVGWDPVRPARPLSLHFRLC
jgi:tripeptidyl-peptidase-1